MHIEISYQNLPHSDALNEHIRQQLDSTIGRFADRVTRVEVHVGDVNAGKSGPDDKRCMMEARPAGADPMVVEAHHSDLHTAIADAAGKLRRVLDKHYSKLAERH